ncbi:hypothetical protein PFISCL1PPCAC_3515 [Pristionchus fissidentatus]|uniref:Uncharacterized protein n=1 Tax=Pristionchus fissidentatus TaxID=1538716 RepID=A0AAV5V1B3_9BILA|nr:hypothetical protein PFISCL1PPCAC_3515 [Pristionchus fissidentatus]
MLRHLCCFSASLLLVSAQIGGGARPVTGPPGRPGIGTPQPNGWGTYTPATFPNSLTDFTACQMPGESLMCDPNAILTDGDLTANHAMLDHVLDSIRSSTQCACTSEDENFGQCEGEGGFTVSLALVDKIELDANQDNKVDRMQAASKFANNLRVLQDHGQCDDDVTIFLSRKDDVMWTATGKVAERYLTPELINAITLNAENYFVKGEYTNGLNYTLTKYGQILRGEQVDLTPPGGWYWPFPLWAVIVIGIVCTLVAIALIGLAVWGCTRCCCADKAEYTMGTRM